MLGVGLSLFHPFRPGAGVAAPAAQSMGMYNDMPSASRSSLGLYFGTRNNGNGYSGALLRVKRSSDNTEQDIFSSNNLDLDTASLLAFAGTGDAIVTKIYNQFNLGQDIVLGGGAPKIVKAGALVVSKNGKPTIELNGSTDYFTGPQMSWMSMALYLGYRTATQPTYATLVGFSNSDLGGTTSGTGSRIANWQGGIAASYHDGQPVTVAGNYDNYNVGVPFAYGVQHSIIDVRVNGYPLFAPDIGRDKTNIRYSSMWFSELACFSAALSEADAKAVAAGSRAYWGD